MMQEHKPIDRDWIEEALIENLDYCRYDIRLKCLEPEIKDCGNCPLNPDLDILIKKD
jgi:hypothetical protein